MPVLAYILLFSFLGGLISLILGGLLLTRETFSRQFSHLLAPFAAGTLLGTAFLDLLPEASERDHTHIFLYTLEGMIIFFLFERFVLFFHHHHQHGENESHEKTEATVPLVIIGDVIHNFIDGVVIAGTFLVSIRLGIVTSLAVAAHEIPHEIGDFSILLHRGLSRSRVLLFSVLSSVATMLGALVTYLVGPAVIHSLPFFLSMTSGFFIYIAASEIIPELHHEHRVSYAILESALLLTGAAVIGVAVHFLG
ncbi:MAG TPA: ZIP family metal transporter [Thermoanaerobaculia bacterium]|nr:ZIP family metal transporter [Thermoanaerobaculia bacterium]